MADHITSYIDVPPQIANTNKLHRIFNPVDPISRTNTLNTIEKLRENGPIAMVCGVFDVLHPNHIAYLQSVYLTAVRETLVKTGLERHEITLDTIFEAIQEDPFVTSLVVSVNGDQDVYNRKSFIPEKGNSIKPVEPWEHRAMNIAQVGIDLPNGFQVPVARVVTGHGVDFSGTPYSYDVELGVQVIKPNFWFAFMEDGNTTALEIQDQIDNGIISTQIIGMPMRSYLENPFTGKPYGTTDTLNRLFTAQEGDSLYQIELFNEG